MRSSTWVCFDCRQSVRRSRSSERPVLCSRCGQASRYLGYKIRLPKRDDPKQWDELLKALQTDRLQTAEAWRRYWIRRRHDLEHQVAKLRTRPKNPGRSRLIKTLEKEIRRLQDKTPPR